MTGVPLGWQWIPVDPVPRRVREPLPDVEEVEPNDRGREE